MAFSISFKDMDGRELAGHDEAGSRYQPGATGASEAKSRWPGGLTTDSRIATASSGLQALLPTAFGTKRCSPGCRIAPFPRAEACRTKGNAMRTITQPPPTSRCDQCGGELRLKLLEGCLLY